jgi:ABC-type transport system substrate-binding protein
MYGNFTKYVRDEKTGKWSVQPWYAEAWELPNPKTMVLKLKKGIKFHDGTAFNADIAKWNLDRMLTHKLSSVRNDIGIIEKVTVVDEYTVRLDLKAPPSGLLVLLSDCIGRGWIVSKAHWEKVGEDVAGRNPVGAGPMTFVHWKNGDNITLKKWDQYWENGEDGKPLPYLDGIEYRIIVDPTAKLLALRSGAIDASDTIPPKDLPSLREPNFQILETEWRTLSSYFFFNTTQAPWKGNTKLRQAVQYSIDKQTIVKTLGFGIGKPAYYHWGPADIGYDDSIPKYDYQPEKAKQLLGEAGYASGFELELSHYTEWPSDKVAEMLQAMWSTMGIRASIRPMERTAFEKAMMAPAFDFGLSLKSIGELDPALMEFRFRSGEIKNYAHYGNPDLDKCFDEGRLAADDKGRAEAYKRCQRIIFEDAAFGVIWFWGRNNIYHKSVKGWTASWRDEPNWTRVWLDK